MKTRTLPPKTEHFRTEDEMSREARQTAAQILSSARLDPNVRRALVAVVAETLEQIESPGPRPGDTLLYTNAELPCEVRILAIAEGYAMVRRKGYMPFVVSVKDLEGER